VLISIVVNALIVTVFTMHQNDYHDINKAMFPEFRYVLIDLLSWFVLMKITYKKYRSKSISRNK
jgi:hypothetical protein